jgi:hypothetical protein
VLRYLTSVEQLEVFILLHRSPARHWSAVEIAQELGIADAEAEAALERLGSDNFLDIKISNDVVYRYNPVDPALREVATRVTEFYVHHRISVMNLITAASLRPIRDFAEAFRLKKDRENG